MSGAGVEIRVEDEQLLRALRSVRRFLSEGGLRGVLDDIGRRLETSTVHRFKTETAPDGTPWKPSLASYSRGPARGGAGNPDRGQTLTATGRLRASITRIVGEDVLRVGTNVVYAAIHQFGGKTPPRTIRPRDRKALAWPGAAHPVRAVRHPGSKIPARPFLGISPGDERAILLIVNTRLKALWK